MSNPNTGALGIPGNLVNQWYPWQYATTGDVSLLEQQTAYAYKCQQYIASVTRVNALGQDVSAFVQNQLTALSQSVAITDTIAKSYFGNITTGKYWASGVCDYYQGYQAILSSGL